MKPKIKVTERMVQTTDGSRELRYYTSVDHGCHIEKQEFLDRLRDQYGIPVVHTLAVLEALQQVLKNDIGRGNIVEVPYLGLFKLQLRAKTVKNADEAGRQAVSRFKVNFLPCREFSRHFSKND
ncbi:MAG: hypothetical protein GXY64_04650 [Bacteroidales bacterium]|nr:hypothetical protein [Bacteroidales bacterium]